MQMLMTPMVTSALSSAQCYAHPHPDGLSSLAAYPSVLCGDPAQMSMLLIGMILLALTVAYIVYVLLIAWILPAKSRGPHGEWWIRAVRFLIFRFNNNKYWWGLILNPRGLVLVLLMTACGTDIQAQCIVFMIVMAFYGLLASAHKPWRVGCMNVYDTVATALLLFIVLASILSFEDTEVDKDFYHSFIAAMYVVAGIILAVLSLCGLLTCASGDSVWFVTNRHKKTADHIAEELQKFTALFKQRQQAVANARLINMDDLLRLLLGAARRPVRPFRRHGAHGRGRPVLQSGGRERRDEGAAEGTVGRHGRRGRQCRQRCLCVAC